MRNLLQFYVFDEHTDYEKECIKIGMKPISWRGGSVKSFLYREYEYIVLNRSDCYSGWEYTIMKLPQLNYAQLYSLAVHTNIYDERVGAIGTILKLHEDEFINFLRKIHNKDIMADKQIRKLSKLILTEIKQRSDFVNEMYELLKLCYEVYNK